MADIKYDKCIESSLEDPDAEGRVHTETLQTTRDVEMAQLSQETLYLSE